MLRFDFTLYSRALCFFQILSFLLMHYVLLNRHYPWVLFYFCFEFSEKIVLRIKTMEVIPCFYWLLLLNVIVLARCVTSLTLYGINLSDPLPV